MSESAVFSLAGYNPVRRTLSLVAAFLAVVLLVMGTLVTGTEAGDSVPDWPLAFGKVIPIGHISGLVIFEYFHRVAGILVGLATLILLTVTLRTDKRRWARILTLMAFLAVLIQGSLGGVRVIFGTAQSPETGLIAAIHATFAQVTFVTLTVLSMINSQSWAIRSPLASGAAEGSFRVSKTLRVFSWIGVATVLIQIFLAACYRHKVFPLTFHEYWAFVAASCISTAAFYALRDSKKADTWLRAPAIFIAIFVWLQMSLGFIAELLWADAIRDDKAGSLIDVIIASSHTILAALLFTSALWLLIRLERLVKTERAVLA